MVEEVGEGLAAGLVGDIEPPVGSREFVGGADLGERISEGLSASVASGVVGHHPVDAAAPLGEGLGSSQDERSAGFAGLVVVDL